MYDTARRVALVKQRVRENTSRRQRCEAISLSALCLMLFTALAKVADALIVRGQTAAQGVFGTMLLREDAGGYVLDACDWKAEHILHVVKTVQYTEETA